MFCFLGFTAQFCYLVIQFNAKSILIHDSCDRHGKFQFKFIFDRSISLFMQQGLQMSHVK